ncbi:MAG: Glu-tRNA(Gln) amidotransferase subunit GatE [Candidatus Acidifodinimicrobium sp.]
MKLKCGFEWHIQLDTNKLFCSCPSLLIDKDKEIEIKRRFKASLGESGKADITASFEEGKARDVIYEAPVEASCLVEADEEPPHEINKEALKIALEMSNALNCKIFDEIIFMRKVIIDGSNTSGFQRTALIAIDGSFKVKDKNIGIATINLEEDSARRVGNNLDIAKFKLDRLGIPLVEIATELIETDEEELKEIAEEFGRFTRLFKVKRGIGTIRQDVNLSIEGGSRVELKGFQDIRHMDKVIMNEAERQKSLLKLINDMGYLSQNLNSINNKDLNQTLSGTKSELIIRGIKSNKLVLGIGFKNFKGIFGYKLCEGKRFGSEVSDYLKALFGAGIIHSDELPAYGISLDDVGKVKEELNLGENDAFLITIIKKEEKERAIDSILNRIRALLASIPTEVRAVNEDNTSSFLRPIGGKDRMYIETDLPIVEVEKDLLKEAEKFKGFSAESLKSKYGLNDDTLNLLIKAKKLDLALKLNLELKLDFNAIKKVLVEDLAYIRHKLSLDLDENAAIDILKRIADGTITKEASVPILERMALNEFKSVDEAIKKLNLRKLDKDELKKEILPIIKSGKLNENEIIIGLKQRVGPRFDYNEAISVIQTLNGKKGNN